MNQVEARAGRSTALGGCGLLAAAGLLMLGFAVLLVASGRTMVEDHRWSDPRKARIWYLADALNKYRHDHGRYPTNEEGFRPLLESDPPYIEQSPSEPWLDEYHYRAPGSRGRAFDVFSYGSDGKPGGRGPDGDCESWNLGPRMSGETPPGVPPRE